MVYDELNKLKQKKKIDDCKITITHNEAPKDEMVINGSDITETSKTHFLYKDVRGVEVHIPMNKVIKIESEGKVIWEKKPASGK